MTLDEGSSRARQSSTADVSGMSIQAWLYDQKLPHRKKLARRNQGG
jgi:hypothetical protein